VLHCPRPLTQVWEYARAKLADAQDEREHREPRMNGSDGADEEPARDMTEHLRLKLSQWCKAAVERTTEDMERLEMHTAVRDVMRLFDRIKDFEKRVIAREGQLGRADVNALIDALTVLAQMLGPLAPHLAEELWIAFGHEEHFTQTPWPGVSFQVPA
jgi:leucyl-tRNA synthetase